MLSSIFSGYAFQYKTSLCRHFAYNLAIGARGSFPTVFLKSNNQVIFSVSSSLVNFYATGVGIKIPQNKNPMFNIGQH